MGYFRHSVKSVTWVGVLRVFTRVLSLGKVAIIARVLSPSQFGLFGIVSIVLAFIEILTETGINVFLIQEKDDIKKYLNTAWIISILRGVFISIIILCISPFIVFFFNSPEVYSLLILVSIVPLVRGFINPTIIIFQKELRFDKDFYFRGSVFLVDTISSVIIVLLTSSPAGIVWGLIIGAIYEVILSFIVIPTRPHFAFVASYSKEILHKGKWVTASGIFNYLYHNLDDIIVGRVINIGALGLYDMAYRISTLPISEIADVISRVAFPVYVKISEDKKRLKRAFLRTIGLVSLLSIPLGMVFVLFPSQIIHIILGEKWVSAAPTLQVLGVFGIVRSISGTTSVLFLSVHKQKYVAAVTFVSFVALAVTITPLVIIYGIIGAAYAAVIGSVAALPFMGYYSLKVLRHHEKS